MTPKKIRITVAAVLIGATVAAHGWSLWDGMFLDDHWHRLQLQNDDWSLSAMLDATTIIPERFIETWWQEKSIQWWYARPFSIFVAKVVYHLSGGSVKAWHAISLSLHLVSTFMVYSLCWQLTHRRRWSVVGALLFVVHSHSVYALGWLAAQNAVLQTALTLAALLCYVRASRLQLYPWADDKQDEQQSDSPSLPRTRSSMHWPAYTATIGFWSLALLSRENAIVFPVFIVAFDWAFGGWQHVRKRFGAYAIVAIIGAAFLVWRLIYFYHPMPEFYVRRPDGFGYLLWCLAKLMHYTTAVVWLSPMSVGPSGRFDPFHEVPGDCALMFAILAIMSAGYYLACRRAPGYWIWPLWIFLALLPAVPIVAAPHTGYMPSIGFAVAMILGPALRDKIRPVSIGRWSPVVATWFLVATIIYMPIYRAMWNSFFAAERLTVASVAASPPQSEATDLFFINLPFANIYAQLHLAEVLDPRSVPDPQTRSTVQMGSMPNQVSATDAILQANPFRCHVLTYSPGLLRVESPCYLTQLDAYRFKVAIDGRPYFSGALGRFLIESMRTGGRMRTGETTQGRLFDVEILRADEDGVRELMFTFHEPLASSRYCFYVTTRQCGAARVHFWGSEPVAPADQHVHEGSDDSISPDQLARSVRRFQSGDARAADLLFAAASSQVGPVQHEARQVLEPLAGPVMNALAAPAQHVFQEVASTPAQWRQARRWWRQFVNDEIFRTLGLEHNRLDALRRQRDRLFGIRQIANQVIQTDLYLTGPPFRSPR